MNLQELRAAVGAGGVESVTLRAEGAGFFVQIDTRSAVTYMLARVRGPEPRCFINPRSGLGMLREAGVLNVTVDLSQWTPDTEEAAPKQQRRKRAAAKPARLR